MRTNVSRAVAGLALTLAFPARAYAYLDPGTGGMMVQAIIAVLAGAGLAVKIFWSKIVGFFRPDRAEPDGSQDHDADSAG